MNKKVLYYGIPIGVIVLIIGWYLISPAFITTTADDPNPLINDALDSMSEEEMEEFEDAVMEMESGNEIDDSMPGEAALISQGVFMERAHEVMGEAKLIDDGSGNLILRFENFDTINGPNLHIYLSADLSEDDFIDLGPIKATSGNVNYDIPPGTDLDKYNKVLVWCVPFKVLFSYAELK